MVMVNPGSSFEKKPQGMCIQPLGTSSILKLLLFSSFCASSRKIPFASLYDILFYSYLYTYTQPQGKRRQPLGTIFLMEAERSYHLITGCMFQKIALPSDFMHIFHDFIHVYSPWAGAGNPLGPKFWCQQEGLITLVICCKFIKNLFNLWLYTHLSWFDQDQDSFLMKRWNDNHSPGPVIRELVPSSHQWSELSNTILCIFSRWDQRIREGIPIPDSLGEEATFINICISNGSLKCHRVLISSTPSFGDKVICRYTGFTFKTFI